MLKVFEFVAVFMLLIGKIYATLAYAREGLIYLFTFQWNFGRKKKKFL